MTKERIACDTCRFYLTTRDHGINRQIGLCTNSDGRDRVVKAEEKCDEWLSWRQRIIETKKFYLEYKRKKS